MKDIENLLNQLQEAEAASQKAQGALDAAMERLVEEFDCSTLAEAKAKLNSLKKKADKLESEYEEAYLKADRIINAEVDEDEDDEEYEDD